ncbi:hypothetical protein ALC62_01585, partial [Cyphomyrmex costatus]
GDKAAVFGADQAQIALCRVGAILRGLEFSLESADPGDALLGHAFLLLQLSLVDADFLGGFVKRFLQQRDVLRVLFNLNHYLLDVALLLTKYLYSLSVSTFFFVQLEFQFYLFSYPGFELADDALASNNGIGLNLFQSHGQILYLNLQRFLDSFNFDNTLLFLMKNFNGVFEFILYSLISLITNSQFLSNLFIISSQSGQFLLQFSL